MWKALCHLFCRDLEWVVGKLVDDSSLCSHNDSTVTHQKLSPVATKQMTELLATMTGTPWAKKVTEGHKNSQFQNHHVFIHLGDRSASLIVLHFPLLLSF